jgi:hypothetical protein
MAEILYRKEVLPIRDRQYLGLFTLEAVRDHLGFLGRRFPQQFLAFVLVKIAGIHAGRQDYSR